ncbi:MAG: hypothetical protein KAR19_03065 [Bacteroidales bacterium]|nr:hypothetical protein [Bacteroidales bacterium]
MVAGISLLVVLFFYASPKTVDYDELEIRVTKALNPVDMTPAPLPTVDTTAQDSASVEEVAAVEEEDEGGAFATVDPIDTSGTHLREHISGWEYLVWFRTDIALIWAYILLLITAIAAVVFPLISVFSNLKGLIRLAVVLAGAAVLVLISYLMASDTPLYIIGYTGTSNSDAGTLKMIDTTLFVTYILFGLALLSILYAVISRAFK